MEISFNKKELIGLKVSNNYYKVAGNFANKGLKVVKCFSLETQTLKYFEHTWLNVLNYAWIWVWEL